MNIEMSPVDIDKWDSPSSLFIVSVQKNPNAGNIRTDIHCTFAILFDFCNHPFYYFAGFNKELRNPVYYYNLGLYDS